MWYQNRIQYNKTTANSFCYKLRHQAYTIKLICDVFIIFIVFVVIPLLKSLLNHIHLSVFGLAAKMIV